MQFIDRGGHIFYVESYSTNPIGYEFEKLPYTFWVDDEYSGALSVGCRYVKVIHALTSRTISDIEVISDSDVFALIPPSVCQGITSVTTDLIISDTDIKKSLGKDDIPTLGGLSDSGGLFSYTIIPIYVTCLSASTGTVLTNILIHLTFDDGSSEYCPITVGGEFLDENEPIIINGRNMGITIPKDIIRAVYRGSFRNDTIDEVLFTTKMKEYLINYMGIRGECGNYASAVKSLRWFGYGDKLDISGLVATDNEFLSQWARDYLSISGDITDAFRYFRNTSLISLTMPINSETGAVGRFRWSDDMWGEGLPVRENLFDKTVPVIPEDTDIVYERPYYDFVLSEMMVKLACLRHYYQKYFLPVSVAIHTASVQWSVTAPSTKFIAKTSVKVTEPTVLAGDVEADVEFPDTDTHYIYNQRIVADDNLNNFAGTTEDVVAGRDETYLLIDDIVITIPIRFRYPKTYSCVFILTKDSEVIHESHFNFFNSGPGEYRNFVIPPKYLNQKYDVNWWEDGIFTLQILCNDVWYRYQFKVRVPEMHLRLGYLKYNYHHQHHRQVESIGPDGVVFNAFMYIPSMVTVNDINFTRSLGRTMTFTDTIIESEYESRLAKYITDNLGMTRLVAYQTKIDSARINLNIEMTVTPDTKYIASDSVVFKYGASTIEGIWDTKNSMWTGSFEVSINPMPDYINVEVELTRHHNMEISGKMETVFKYVISYNPEGDDCPFNCGNNDCIYKVYKTKQSGVVIDRNSTSVVPVTEPEKTSIYSDLHTKEVENLITHYSETVSVVDAPQYINRIHIYDIEAPVPVGTGPETMVGKIPFDDTADPTPMYSDFFDTDGTCTITGIPGYDFFLMHDTTEWYGVLISKYPISDYTDGGLDVPESIVHPGVTSEYVLTRRGSSDKMLINRMMFVDTAGINHFKLGDIIIVGMDNLNMPYVYELGTKWEISQTSISDFRGDTVTSKTNTAIVSIDPDNTGYKRGYYDITIHYSVDAHIQHRRVSTVKFRVD